MPEYLFSRLNAMQITVNKRPGSVRSTRRLTFNLRGGVETAQRRLKLEIGFRNTQPNWKGCPCARRIAFVVQTNNPCIRNPNSKVGLSYRIYSTISLSREISVVAWPFLLSLYSLKKLQSLRLSLSGVLNETRLITFSLQCSWTCVFHGHPSRAPLTRRSACEYLMRS